MSDPDPERVNRVMQADLKMVELDIGGLEQWQTKRAQRRGRTIVSAERSRSAETRINRVDAGENPTSTPRTNSLNLDDYEIVGPAATISSVTAGANSSKFSTNNAANSCAFTS